MAEKKPFIEPRIVADTDLETADRNFPLMPLVGGSGAVTDVADGAAGDNTNVADGVN